MYRKMVRQLSVIYTVCVLSGPNYYFQNSVVVVFCFVFCTGCTVVPHYTYKENQDAFASKSLQIKPELISVLSKIMFECSKIENMKLFNVLMLKPLWLNEFEVIQSQVHTQVPKQ